MQDRHGTVVAKRVGNGQIATPDALKEIAWSLARSLASIKFANRWLGQRIIFQLGNRFAEYSTMINKEPAFGPLKHDPLSLPGYQLEFNTVGHLAQNIELGLQLAADVAVAKIVDVERDDIGTLLSSDFRHLPRPEGKQKA